MGWHVIVAVNVVAIPNLDQLLDRLTTLQMRAGQLNVSDPRYINLLSNLMCQLNLLKFNLTFHVSFIKFYPSSASINDPLFILI